MTTIEIQDELKKRNIPQAEIAYGLKPPVTPMTVSKVINKVIVSNRIMRAVASKIGKPHWEVFPEYYLAPPKRSTSKTMKHAA